MFARIQKGLSTNLGHRYERVIAVLKEHWFTYLLFLPTLLYLVFIVWAPFIRGIWMSLHIWPAFGVPEWDGIQNYTYLLGWDPFFTSVRATAIYMTMTILQLILALGASLAARNLSRFDNIVDGIFLIPYTMPPVVTGTVWLYILHPNSGPLMGWLLDSGILSEPIFWRTDGTLSISVLTLVGAWTFWQLGYLIFAASISGIPDEHYETARVYGASRIQQFLKVTMPHLKGAFIIVVSLRIVRNLIKVSQPLQMTQGGPGFDTSVLGILLYRFTLNQRAYGLAFAVGFIMFLLAIGATFLFIREFRRGQMEASA